MESRDPKLSVDIWWRNVRLTASQHNLQTKHWFKMALRKCLVQTFLSNCSIFWMFWDLFLTGNVVFVMALHPVSIYLTYCCIFMMKKFNLLSFCLLLSTNHRNQTKLSQVFYLFSGLGMEERQIHCQTVFHLSETLEDVQLELNPRIRVRFYANFMLPQTTVSTSRQPLEITTSLWRFDMTFYMVKWWPEPHRNYMKWLFCHLEFIWSKIDQIWSCNGSSDGCTVYSIWGRHCYA